MKHNGGRVRKLLPKLFLIILGFLFGALIAEIALRVAGYSYPEFYALDQVRGYGLAPGAQGWYRKEGRSYVRINSDGLRDQEHSTTKPPKTLRIALIGDSYPEALTVPLEQSFAHVAGLAHRELEDRLSVLLDVVQPLVDRFMRRGPKAAARGHALHTHENARRLPGGHRASVATVQGLA